MISFVGGSFFHHLVFIAKSGYGCTAATPKGRLRATPETSAAIKADKLGVHNPLWHGPTHPWQRDAFRTGRATKWKMEPCHLLASGTAAHASRSVAFFERNLVQGTSEVVGRGQAKEAMSKQAKQAQPPSAEEGSHFVVATRACERNPLSSRRSLARLGVRCGAVADQRTSTVDAPLIPSSIQSKYPSFP